MNVREFGESDFLTKDFLATARSRTGIFLSSGVREVGKFGPRLKILVEIDGRQKYWNPNKISVNNIIKSYGEESDGWIGKRVLFKVEEQKIVGTCDGA